MDKRGFISFVERLRRINKFVDNLMDLGVNIMESQVLDDIFYCADEVIEQSFDVIGRDAFFAWFYEDVYEHEENGVTYNFTEDPATIWEFLQCHLA